MSDEITNTAEIAEREWDEIAEPEGTVRADISATQRPTDDRIQFHVQMLGYTMREMDNLIIEAAAQLIVGKHNDRAIAKAIEDKCIELVNTKATKALDAVTTEIIEQPITPNWGDKKPVTMRELIGLYGREFLETTVDREGKPSRSGYSDLKPRISYLVERYLDRKFQAEIEKATTAAIVTMQRLIKAQHEKVLAAELERLRTALAKVTTP